MPNIFTAIAPTLFSAARAVAAERFGAVAAINAQFDDKGVARGDKVVVPVAPVRASSAFSPGATSSSGGDATASNVEVTITKSQKVDWHLTGEQIRSLENGGNYQEWVTQLIQQGMRTLRNEAEVDCAAAIALGASRAAGSAGTNPFASNIDSLADARQILADNGAPMADLQCVMNTTAGTALRKLGVITQAYNAGSDAERRSGQFLRQYGFELRESAGVATFTKGTASGATTDNAGYAVGATVITLASAGTGTILAGDVITFAGDANQYVVASGDAQTSNGGTITLAEPGLRKAIAASATNITVVNSHTCNVAFERNAVVGIMRPPLIPANPTISQQLISDPQGMTYLLLDIAQYGQRTWELHLAWGFKAVNTFAIAKLLG